MRRLLTDVGLTLLLVAGAFAALAWLVAHP